MDKQTRKYTEKPALTSIKSYELLLLKTPAAVHRRRPSNVHVLNTVLNGKAFFQTAPRPLQENVVIALVGTVFL